MIRTFLFLSAFFGIMIFQACHHSELENPELSQTETFEGIKAIAINGAPPPELCRFFCSGSCTGNVCKMTGSWNTGFQCGPCQECFMVFVYDDIQLYPGDPGYDDLWDHVYGRDPLLEEVDQFLTTQQGLDTYQLEEGYLFSHPETENYAFRYHLSAEDGTSYSVMAIKDEGGIAIYDCGGTCKPYPYDDVNCLEVYHPNSNSMYCSCSVEEGCFESYFPIH